MVASAGPTGCGTPTALSVEHLVVVLEVLLQLLLLQLLLLQLLVVELLLLLRCQVVVVMMVNVLAGSASGSFGNGLLMQKNDVAASHGGHRYGMTSHDDVWGRSPCLLMMLRRRVLHRLLLLLLLLHRRVWQALADAGVRVGDSLRRGDHWRGHHHLLLVGHAARGAVRSLLRMATAAHRAVGDMSVLLELLLRAARRSRVRRRGSHSHGRTRGRDHLLLGWRIADLLLGVVGKEVGHGANLLLLLWLVLLWLVLLRVDHSHLIASRRRRVLLVYHNGMLLLLLRLRHRVAAGRRRQRGRRAGSGRRRRDFTDCNGSTGGCSITSQYVRFKTRPHKVH